MSGWPRYWVRSLTTSTFLPGKSVTRERNRDISISGCASLRSEDVQIGACYARGTARSAVEDRPASSTTITSILLYVDRMRWPEELLGAAALRLSLASGIHGIFQGFKAADVLADLLSSLAWDRGHLVDPPREHWTRTVSPTEPGQRPEVQSARSIHCERVQTSFARRTHSPQIPGLQLRRLLSWSCLALLLFIHLVLRFSVLALAIEVRNHLLPTTSSALNLLSEFARIADIGPRPKKQPRKIRSTRTLLFSRSSRQRLQSLASCCMPANRTVPLNEAPAIGFKLSSNLPLKIAPLPRPSSSAIVILKFSPSSGRMLQTSTSSALVASIGLSLTSGKRRSTW
ncbi:hypothetical protein KC356_g68 [Hortaea werneckii]|nr:hypothetical protein KC356_g68 [Hortaea werneckii]